jgi:hypothetical protein
LSMTVQQLEGFASHQTIRNHHMSYKYQRDYTSYHQQNPSLHTQDVTHSMLESMITWSLHTAIYQEHPITNQVQKKSDPKLTHLPTLRLHYLAREIWSKRLSVSDR